MKKKDYVFKAETKGKKSTENSSVIDINNTEETKETANNEVKAPSELTDEEINGILASTFNGVYDYEGRVIMFPDKNQAILFASYLQQSNMNIRFCKIAEVFSVFNPPTENGLVYIVEPMTTEKSADWDTKQLEFPDDFTMISQYVLMCIVEHLKRKNNAVEKK